MRWKQTDYCGWGRALRASGPMARPERQADLAKILQDQPGPAIGNRRSYGDTCLNSDHPVIDMTRLDRFIAFNADTGLLEAESGVTIGDIFENFGPKGWMPAVMPGTGFATLGGAIANDVHGKNHQIAGSFGQHVEAIFLMNPAGQATWISLSENADLFRATIGGLGQTGVILKARINLARCLGGTMAVSERRIDDLEAFMDAFQTSSAAYQVGWLDMTADGEHFGRGIFEEGHPADGPFSAPRKTKSVPFNMPGFALARPIVKAFNALYRRRVPESGREVERPMREFFFPLDRIQNWNKLYGKRGFHQFQCVLPDDNIETTLPRLLNEVVDSGLASPLSVLKRLGSGRAGMMSFPMEGYTLAVDIRSTRKSASLLARLNEITKNAGGRVYLAKDSSLDPAYFPDMYHELPAFQEVCQQADPTGIFETDQTRRLNLRGAS